MSDKGYTEGQIIDTANLLHEAGQPERAKAVLALLMENKLLSALTDGSIYISIDAIRAMVTTWQEEILSQIMEPYARRAMEYCIECLEKVIERSEDKDSGPATLLGDVR